MKDEYGYPIGNCFEEAAMLLLNESFPHMAAFAFDWGLSPNAELVHGLPTLQRPPYAKYTHAWVEDEDGQDGRIFHPTGDDRDIMVLDSPDLYYHMGGIDPSECARYTAEQTRQMLLDHEHWGPWEPHFYKEDVYA